MGQARFTLSAELKAEINDFKRGLNKATKYSKQNARQISRSLDGVTNSLANITSAIGIAFGARELMTYAKDAVDLAGEISGVEEAFNKLEKANLNDLREQTKGTASDFQLMKAAVKAAEFGIDSSKMPQLMQFAAVQANKMGESVDYMVESIVTGLARNSIPILDNLGLSSVMLKERMKETGDISSAALAVINEKLKESGGLSDNAGTKAAQLKADFANLKAEIGKELTPAFNELFGELKTHLPDIMQNAKAVAQFIANNFDLILQLISAIGGLVLALKTVKAAQIAFNTVTKANPYVLLATALIGVAEALKKVNDQIDDANERFRTLHTNFDRVDPSNRTRLYQEFSMDELLNRIEDKLKKIDNLKKKIAANEGDVSQHKKYILQYEKIIAKIKEEIDIRNGNVDNDKSATQKKLENLEILEAELKELMKARQTASLSEIGAINDEIKALQKKIDKYKDATAEIKELSGELSKMESKGVDNVGEIKFKQKKRVGLDTEVNKYGLRTSNDETKLQQQNLNYWQKLQEQITSTDVLVGTFENSINTLSDAFVDMFETGEMNFNNLVLSMLDGLRQIINGLLAQAIANMITKESSKGVVGLALAAGGVAAIQGMFKSNVPEFANGGIVYGETLAKVGEYSGARSNPEVIAPLNKLKSLLGNTGVAKVEGEFRVRGTDLIASINNTESRIKRTR